MSKKKNLLSSTSSADVSYKFFVWRMYGRKRTCIFGPERILLLTNAFSDIPITRENMPFVVCRKEVQSLKVKVMTWVEARNTQTSHYRGTHLVFICYDITNYDTAEEVRQSAMEVERYARPGAKKVLVGIKCDLEDQREVTLQEGRELAKLYHFDYFTEVSFKENINVESLFNEALMCLIRSHEFSDPSAVPPLIALNNRVVAPKKNKGGKSYFRKNTTG